jgi:hypothetical protein
VEAEASKLNLDSPQNVNESGFYETQLVSKHKLELDNTLREGEETPDSVKR